MVKAGSAGSNPDSVANEADHDPSHALNVFLREVGQTVFVLNTVVVGLSAVADGYQKPDTLDISWNPSDRSIAERKSRKFVVEAVLVRFAEAAYQYTSAVASLPRLSAVRARWNGDTSKAEKVAAVSVELLSESYLGSAAQLVTHWRNRIVHGSSTAKLSPEAKKVLQHADAEVLKRYKGLSVDRLLGHFEEGRPTLKDVSSLIAMTIGWAREIDQALYTEIGKQELDAWLEHYDLWPGLRRLERETPKDKRAASIGRYFDTYAPSLKAAYAEHYLEATAPT